MCIDRVTFGIEYRYPLRPTIQARTPLKFVLERS
jgi:hypothetical protein